MPPRHPHAPQLRFWSPQAPIEYIAQNLNPLGAVNAETNQSSHVSNVVADPSCDTIPWRHLLPGGSINPTTQSLIGAFGHPIIGYHSELKCLMNGTQDNASFYGGDDFFRSTDRLCNFCRELAAFRILERIGLLDDAANSLPLWASDYRGPFYTRFGFSVPSPLPQENNEGTPFF